MVTFNSKNNIICFSRDELFYLFKLSKQSEMVNEMKRTGLSFDDLRRDYSLMEKLADFIGVRGAEDRDEHEIFATLFVFTDFFNENCKICFELENFDSQRDRITNTDDLIRFRKISSDSDFIILQDDGFRKFQLKRYRGEMIAEKIADFIKKKLDHYGGSLEANLWIILQPKAWTESKIEFCDLHTKLQSLNLNYENQILISYNDKNEKEVLVQVYPQLAKMTRLHKKYIEQL